MEGSFDNLKLAIGDTFAEPFRKAVTYVNGFLIAITNVIRMFKPLITETGNPLPDNNILSGINDELEETQENLGLLSFDKFNVLNTGKTEKQGNDDITQALTSELERQQALYDSISAQMSNINNEAVEISKNIQNWIMNLGLIEFDNEGIAHFSEKAKNISKTIASIIALLVGISAVFKVGNLITGITKINSSLSGLSVILTAISSHPIIGAIAAIVALLTALYITNEDFRKSINKLINLLSNLLNGLIKPIIPILSNLLNITGNGLAVVIENIVSLLEELSNNETIKWVLELIKAVNELEIIFIPLKIAILAIQYSLELLIRGLKTAINVFSNFAEAVSSVLKGDFDGAWKHIANGFAKMVNGIANGFISLVNFIIDVLNKIIEPIDKIANFFGAKEGTVQIPHWDAEMNWHPYAGEFAQGGIPPKGSLFTAGEAGAELVGNINGRTSVVNQEQLSADLTQAVYVGSMRMLRDSGLLNNINNTNINFDINPSAFARAIRPYMDKENKRGGYNK